MLSIVCPACENPFQVPESKLGQFTRCSDCEHRFAVVIDGPVVSEDPDDAPQPVQRKKKKKKTKKGIRAKSKLPVGIYVAIALLVTIFFVSIIWFVSTSGPKARGPVQNGNGGEEDTLRIDREPKGMVPS